MQTNLDKKEQLALLRTSVRFYTFDGLKGIPIYATRICFFYRFVLYDFGEIYKYRLLKHVKIHQSVKHCLVR